MKYELDHLNFCDKTPLKYLLEGCPYVLRERLYARNIRTVGELHAEWRRNGLDWVGELGGCGKKTVGALLNLCEEHERRERKREEREAENASPVDWEQRRYEIAREALAAMIGNHNLGYHPDLAKNAVKAADALVGELKRNYE